ncbi:MAG TPA: erythromycin esterase family protein [Chitinophagaceae bacterium]|nr:erythromycin esterase family protein [Chitinophagaceae bacterium]
MPTLLLMLVLSVWSCAQSKKSAGLQPSTELFLQKELITISENGRFAPANWEPVIKHLKDKRLVLLGELNHGAGEMFALRNDLIRHLYNKTDPFVLLFEAGIGELAQVEMNKSGMSPAEMTFGFFEIWRTKEFQELMEFARVNRIPVAGFDVQRSGRSFNKLLTKLAAQTTTDSARYIKLEERFGVLQQAMGGKKAVYDSLKDSVTDLVNSYQRVHDLINETNSGTHSAELLFVLQTIRNRIGFLSYMLQFVRDRDFNKRLSARDSMMADNIIWLAENIYKKEKLVIIGHNYHIAKSNNSDLVMGQLLSRKYGRDMYCMGMFAGSGTYNGNSGKPVNMLPADSSALDIKHIVSRLNGSAGFLNISPKRKAGDQWLHEPIVVNDSFIDLAERNTMILSKLFDGLLMIRTISPPQKDQ